MADYETPAQDRVPLLEKAAFGSGHLVNNLIPGALGVFMFFLLTAFGMDPFLAGLLGGLPRLVDAISDPLMGYISDNTNTRWGMNGQEMRYRTYAADALQFSDGDGIVL